jgi:hypothetical protein
LRPAEVFGTWPVAPTYVLVDRLEDLDCGWERTHLGDTDERTPDANARFEERRVCSDALGALQPSKRVNYLQSVQWERNHLTS